MEREAKAIKAPVGLSPPMDLMMLALIQGRLRQAARRLTKRTASERGRGGEGVALVPAHGELEGVICALEMIEAGRYGRCQSCGAALSEDHLLQNPSQLTCVHCRGR